MRKEDTDPGSSYCNVGGGGGTSTCIGTNSAHPVIHSKYNQLIHVDETMSVQGPGVQLEAFLFENILVLSMYLIYFLLINRTH